MAINKNKMRNLVKDMVMGSITDSVVEDAVVTCLSNLDIRAVLTEKLADAIDYKITDYVDDIIDDVASEAADDILSEIFE